MAVVSDYTGLLSGASFSASGGRPAFVSYSFPVAVPDYLLAQFPGSGLATFRAFTPDQQAAARAAVAAWAAESGLTFFEVAPGEGDIKFMAFDLAAMGTGGAGFSSTPRPDGLLLASSDVFVDHAYATDARILLHEIGHALGLKHPFEGENVLAPALDTISRTVMSYTGDGTSGTVLGDLDRQAIQALYGTASQQGTGSIAWSWNAASLTLTQTGTSAADTIYGIGGTDVIQGRGGDDLIYGREGAGTLDGGTGNDTIVGGARARMTGGDGNDALTLVVDAATLRFDIDGGAGTDSLFIDLGNFAGSAISLPDALAAGSVLAGIEQITISFPANAAGDHAIIGSGLGELIYGSAANDAVEGRGGNDTLVGGGGNDRFIGGEGNDIAQITLFAGTQTLHFDGGSGADALTIVIAPGTTRLDFDLARLSQRGIGLVSVEGVNVHGSAAAETFRDVGTARGNQVLAGGGNDVIYANGWNWRPGAGLADNASGTMSYYNGGDGNDTIHVGHSQSFVLGGTGADRFVFDHATDLDATNRTQFEDFQSGIDVLDLSAIGVGNLAISGNWVTGTTSAGSNFSLYVRTSITLSDIRTSPSGTPPSQPAEGGATPSDGATFGRALPTGDFNGDGRADILWRHAGDGTFSNWLGRPDGGFANNDRNTMVRGIGTDWQIMAAGDFNGDGRDDLLWRNTGSGTFSNWLGLANGAFAGNDGAALTAGVGLEWRIAGVGDFNGDGRDDIAWRNSMTGAFSNWLARADGGFTGNDGNAFAAVPLDWQIAGAGDFNGDGRDDLLWRSATGQVSNWLGRANGGFTTNDAAASRLVPLDWHILGTGDFNGDGRDDILWRNDSGMMANWLGRADGGFASNDAAFMVPVGLDWNVVAIDDFNGDGRDDLLWRQDGGMMSNWLARPAGDFAGNDANAAAFVEPEWRAGIQDVWAL